jgi:hypothetical protein
MNPRRIIGPAALMSVLLLLGIAAFHSASLSPPAAARQSGDPSPAADPTLPLRAAFYYPWFPQGWTQLGIFPYTYYRPGAGFYDSANPELIQQHIAAMQYGGIGAGITSWWGPDSPTDDRVAALLVGAQYTSFRWAVYYENEGYSDPLTDVIRSDLTYLRDHYSTHPAYLRLDNRFVVFVYGGESCAGVDRWRAANTVGAYIVLKVFPDYATCPNQPDGWHQYNPDQPSDHQPGYSYSISPGFWFVGQTPRLERDLARWRQNIRDMIASGAPFQLVQTFNEWGEGTAVEAADVWSSPSGYGVYLDALHDNGAVIPTPTPGPLLVGQVTWQGRAPAPSAGQQLPLTLTLRLGTNRYTYPFRTTDARGVLTIAVGTLPNGVYTWWAKGCQSLASTGSVTLSGAPATALAVGVLRTGDVNNDNMVDIADFTLLRASFGKVYGVPGYDARADLSGDGLVDITDFTLLRGNFGQIGPPPP